MAYGLLSISRNGSGYNALIGDLNFGSRQETFPTIDDLENYLKQTRHSFSISVGNGISPEEERVFRQYSVGNRPQMPVY